MARKMKTQTPKQHASHELLGVFLFFVWFFAAIEIWFYIPVVWQWYGKLLAIFVIGALLTAVYYIFDRSL